MFPQFSRSTLYLILLHHGNPLSVTGFRCPFGQSTTKHSIFGSNSNGPIKCADMSTQGIFSVPSNCQLNVFRTAIDSDQKLGRGGEETEET